VRKLIVDDNISGGSPSSPALLKVSVHVFLFLFSKWSNRKGAR